MKLKKLFSTVILSVIFTFVFQNIGYAQASEQPVTSTQILQTTTSWNQHDIQYPSEAEEITALHIEFAPGAETPWHRHPVPSLAYIISGELEVTVKDGKKKTFKSGDAFAEVINTWHSGKNIGDEPVKLVVFYVGEKGMKLTELMYEAEE